MLKSGGIARGECIQFMVAEGPIWCQAPYWALRCEDEYESGPAPRELKASARATKAN